MGSVEPEKFGKVLSRLTDININNTRVTDLQLEELFRMIPITGKVRRLGMQALNISSVNSDLFASAVQGLEYLNMAVTTHTKEQIRAVFDKWAEKCTLKEVKMSQASFSSVEPEVFGKVLSCIEKVAINSSKVNTYQATELFLSVAITKQLKILNVCGNDLSNVDSRIFGKGVSMIEEANLESTEITAEQASHLFINLSEFSSKLQILSLVRTDLSLVVPEVLAEGVITLKEANLYSTSLNEEQVDVLLRHCLEQPTQLYLLTIRENGELKYDRQLYLAVCKKLGDRINV